MNVLFFSDFSIADQQGCLMRLLNQSTEHKARMLVLRGDYLKYGGDVLLSAENREEAIKLVEWADFYHMGRGWGWFSELGLKWEDYLTPRNSLVTYYGTEVRTNGKEIYKWHGENKITGVSFWDYTMLKDAPLFYHIPILLDFTRLPPRRQRELSSEPVLVAHATTNREVKKTALFLKVMGELKEKKLGCSEVVIEGKTNEECLAIKSGCDIDFCEFGIGIYGSSALESMAMGIPVLTGMCNFARSFYPDCPVVDVNAENLSGELEYLIRNENARNYVGGRCREWANRVHNPDVILRQWTWMYDFVVNGLRQL